MLILAVALALTAQPTTSLQGHASGGQANMSRADTPSGGRTWLLPAKLPKCLSNGYCFTAKDLRETKESREAERREWERTERRAKRGDVRAMSMGGFMLLNGVMAPKDEAAAMGWFYEAAIRGEVVSMYALGCAFRDRVGVAPDPKLSIYWLNRAAARGYKKQC